MIKPDWIAVDWGTSRLRAWAMAQSSEMLERCDSDDGMSGLSPQDFEPALLRLIEPWLGQTRLDVLCCGMVGARQGWIEAPYVAVPCPVEPAALTEAPVSDHRISVRIAPGVKQADPADVMRGEETQIAGLLLDRPEFDGVVCLPGTHSKWVHVSAGEIVSFRTFMTGELFGFLADQSVLRHSVGDGWDDDAFVEAVADAISKPEMIAARLFSLRAESLLGGLAGATARARLSGLLIGVELAAARPYWLGRDVAIIGAGSLAAAYNAALSAQGVAPSVETGGDMALKGLVALRNAMAPA
ncbi:MAG: 2-dehydro-3-deoxygalactonokinase [Pseudomonadota bacterium]